MRRVVYGFLVESSCTYFTYTGSLKCICQSFGCSCRDFHLYAEDGSVLRVVDFNMKMKSVKFYNFLNVKGLLVKCSEAGNVAAQHVLAKVITKSPISFCSVGVNHSPFLIICFRNALYLMFFFKKYDSLRPFLVVIIFGYVPVKLTKIWLEFITLSVPIL